MTETIIGNHQGKQVLYYALVVQLLDHYNQCCMNAHQDIERNVSSSKIESPLYRYSNIVTNLRGRAEEIADNSEGNKLNPTHYLAFFPLLRTFSKKKRLLWSSVLLGSVDHYSRTPGTSMDDTKQLKQEDFEGLKLSSR